MRRTVFLITASFFLFFCSAGISSADTITYEFKGIVSSYASHESMLSSDDVLPVKTGDTFSGQLSYSDTVPALDIGYALNFGSFSVATGAPIISYPNGLLRLNDSSAVYTGPGSVYVGSVCIEMNPSAGTGGTGWISIVDSAGWTTYTLSGKINITSAPSAVSAVPEPSTLMLILLTGPVLAVVAGLKKQTKKISHKA
jgi:hypothetical protein